MSQSYPQIIDRYIEKCINSWVCKKMKKWSHVTEKKKLRPRNNFAALARPVPTPSKQESERRSKPGSCGISPFLADR